MNSSRQVINQIANHVLRGAPDAPNVLIGPLGRAPDGDGEWCFVVGSGGPDGFRSDQILAADEALGSEIRAALLVELLHRRPIVVHDFDDELEMAKWAAALWPSDKTANIRAGIEAERQNAAMRLN